MSIQASLDAMDFSQSLAGPQHRPSHAKVLSTTQRRGGTSKPLALSERLTVSLIQSPKCSGASRGFGPPCPVSILDIGAVDDQTEHQADGIDKGMTPRVP